MRKYRMKKGWWLLHFGRMLGPKILLNVYIPPRRLTVCITSCLYFITPVFKNLKAGLALFLEHDQSEWDNLEQYKRNQDTCHSVKVVNDFAAQCRSNSTFNSSLTRVEEQKQFILQVVEQHRQICAAPVKAAAINRANAIIMNYFELGYM